MTFVFWIQFFVMVRVFTASKQDNNNKKKDKDKDNHCNGLPYFIQSIAQWINFNVWLIGRQDTINTIKYTALGNVDSISFQTVIWRKEKPFFIAFNSGNAEHIKSSQIFLITAEFLLSEDSRHLSCKDMLQKNPPKHIIVSSSFPSWTFSKNESSVAWLDRRQSTNES